MIKLKDRLTSMLIRRTRAGEHRRYGGSLVTVDRNTSYTARMSYIPERYNTSNDKTIVIPTLN